MAGARGLWRATGMKDSDFGKPIIAIVNSFTQFVPGHVHLKDLGQMVAREVEAAGGVAKEFNTIAVDDGIAMGHDGMLYSLPSREIIADSVEYMVNAHCADAMVCISNCDKITPGMLMAAMRLNIPVVFVSGGPMEAGKVVRTTLPASIGPPETNTTGMFKRMAAINIPGVILSQLEIHTIASAQCAFTMYSTLSAIISRDGSEYSIPSWPIAIPSSTAIVLNSLATPPAASTSRATIWPKSLRWTCPGTNCVNEFTIAIMGLPKSLSFMPVARHKPRAPAILRP